jgi:hypothetical protein
MKLPGKKIQGIGIIRLTDEMSAGFPLPSHGATIIHGHIIGGGLKSALVSESVVFEDLVGGGQINGFVFCVTVENPAHATRVMVAELKRFRLEDIFSLWFFERGKFIRYHIGALTRPAHQLFNEKWVRQTLNQITAEGKFLGALIQEFLHAVIEDEKNKGDDNG